ncbi:MAG: radical SAM family heme chaperone HemW [Planctomycetes bacterium]|nr:radical SAM family heme chaperone HemW [Planctomycetota bacterium]
MFPRSAYVHVPFCAHRCGYCNFTLVAGRDELVGPYLDALTRELTLQGSAAEVDTLFFGGGTPTHLAPADLTRLLTIVLRQFSLAAGAEFSVEANPVDLDEARLDVLSQFGVTRISLGAQSFDASKLKLLERDHSAADIARAFEGARRHVAQVSLDLIFATPGETLDAWQRDLELALQLRPDHISTYGLTFERGTSFYARQVHGQLAAADEELQRQMYLTSIDRLTGAALEHYEVSNFARPGSRCRHNEVYWTGGTFFAVGPGAARYIDGRREVNHRSTTTYIRRVLAGESAVAESEQLGPEDAARERLVFGLRRLQGIELAEFEHQTGYNVTQLGGAALARHIDAGRLELTATRLRLTREGLLLSDAIWPDLLRV